MRGSQGLIKIGRAQGTPPLAWKIWKRDRCGTGGVLQRLEGPKGSPRWLGKSGGGTDAGPSRGFQTFEGHQGNPRDTFVGL